MLNITEKHKVYLAINSIDFRKRLDGTLALCRLHFQCDPADGHIFVFRNRKRTVVRCIVYDKNGFWFMEKRLSKSKFLHWPKTRDEICELTEGQLHYLLSNEAT